MYTILRGKFGGKSLKYIATIVVSFAKWIENHTVMETIRLAHERAKFTKINVKKKKKKKERKGCGAFCVLLSVLGQIRPDIPVGRKTPKLTTYLEQTTTL